MTETSITEEQITYMQSRGWGLMLDLVEECRKAGYMQLHDVFGAFVANCSNPILDSENNRCGTREGLVAAFSGVTLKFLDNSSVLGNIRLLCDGLGMRLEVPELEEPEVL